MWVVSCGAQYDLLTRLEEIAIFQVHVPSTLVRGYFNLLDEEH
jgi:hypothetical protein